MPEPRPRNCIDCGKPITRRATRCGSCQNRYRIQVNPALLPRGPHTAEQKARARAITQRYMADAAWKAHWRETVVPVYVRRGAEHHNWKGGIAPETARLRMSGPSLRWRKAVFERDGYRCRECGRHDYLVAHHIKAWADFPDLRFVLSNGTTLCPDCHSKAHGRRIVARHCRQTIAPVCPGVCSAPSKATSRRSE